MPVYLEPKQEFPVVLKRDADKTPRPQFWARSVTMREQIALGEVIDMQYDPEVKPADLMERTIGKFLELVSHTSNMPGAELNKEWLLDNLSYQEIREVLVTILHNNHLDHETKKD